RHGCRHSSRDAAITVSLATMLRKAGRAAGALCRFSRRRRARVQVLGDSALAGDAWDDVACDRSESRQVARSGGGIYHRRRVEVCAGKPVLWLQPHVRAVLEVRLSIAVDAASPVMPGKDAGATSAAIAAWGRCAEVGMRDEVPGVSAGRKLHRRTLVLL